MQTIDENWSRSDMDRDAHATGRRCDALSDDGTGPDITGGVDASARLSRLARWCVQGRLAAAELDLHQWSRESACPTAARVLLASLWARRGADHDAIALLNEATDPTTAQDHTALLLRMTLAMANDDADALADASQQLADVTREDDQTTAAWLNVAHWHDEPPTISPDRSAHILAGELRDHPHALPSLVYAQKVTANPDDIALLRKAIALNIDEQNDDNRNHITHCVALAELALLAGDDDAARTWSHRGLAIDPYNATLALTLAQVDDDEAVGPPARDVLAQVVSAHPTWPDIEAALIRRQVEDGRVDEARWRISTWQQRHPDHPNMPDTPGRQQEIAA